MTFSGRLEAVSEVAEEQIGSWEPGGGLDVERAIAATPDFFERLSATFKSLGDRLGDGPFEQASREFYQEAAASIAGLADEFGAAHQQFRIDHADELKRLEEPRPQEQMWDTDKQETGV